ncbi:MAG TPA: hypothetical protein VL172_08510, partial [Kofleriaceae bacterium]|nr:hypothetical protein [Kofleriaceae bacterium]
VLNNWRRHREDAGRRQVVDLFSSGQSFDGWKVAIDRRVRDWEDTLPVKFADTWLLNQGWRRRGLISPWERPAAARVA